VKSSSSSNSLRAVALFVRWKLFLQYWPCDVCVRVSTAAQSENIIGRNKSEPKLEKCWLMRVKCWRDIGNSVSDIRERDNKRTCYSAAATAEKCNKPAFAE
jgi:hypothetical protein